MTKKPYGLDQSGCMWGFISILDFRSHSTKKLLSGRSLDEGSDNMSNEFEGNSIATAGVGKSSVKKLMEEEMLGDKDIRNVQVEKKQVDDGSQTSKGHKRNKSRTWNKSDNASGNSGPQQSCRHNSEQQSVSNNLNVDAIIREFCSQIPQDSLSCEEMKPTSKHCEVVKVFINQKCCNQEQYEENGKFQNSKALMDALEILRTDKELFLTLLQDSNSEDVGDEKSNQEIVNPIKPELSPGKKHNFFRRMIKSPDRNSLNRNEDSNRIVLLKPVCKDPTARSASHLFFSGIKRRLKHAIGMENQNPGSCGKGVLDEDVGMSSPTKDHFFMERIVKPSMATRIRDNARKSEIGTVNDSEQRVSNIYVEAKKHLSDMLSNGDEDETTPIRLVQKSLGRILSLPEYDTPSVSPRREQEPNFTATQTRLSTSDNSTPLTQNVEAQTCSSGGDSCDSSLLLESGPNISEGVVHEDEPTSSGGDMEIAKTTDDVAKEEEIDAMDASAEPVVPLVTKQIGETPETIHGNEYSQDLKEDVYVENQPQSSPLASSISSKVEDPKIVIDVQDRSTRISVHDVLFIEDAISHGSTEYQPGEDTHLKSCRDDKESILEYVRAVLQASGLNLDELYMRSLSSDQLLNPMLLNDIDFFSNQLCHDKKLLFDCMNEVLMEAYVQHLGCSHWVSFVKPGVPNTKSAIQGVWEGICWHLLPRPLPQTLEQIVGKDMARSGTWMDLRLDVESIGTEICEVVFQELMEDIVISRVDDVQRSESTLAVKETERSMTL